MRRMLVVSMFVAAMQIAIAADYVKVRKEVTVPTINGQHIFIPSEIALPVTIQKYENNNAALKELESNVPLFTVEKQNLSLENVDFKFYKNNMTKEEVIKILPKVKGLEEYLSYRRLLKLEGEKKEVETIYDYFSKNEKYLKYTVSLPEYAMLTYKYQPLLVIAAAPKITFSSIMAYHKANGMEYKIEKEYEEKLFLKIASQKILSDENNITDILAAMKYWLSQDSFNRIVKEMEGKKEFSKVTEYLKLLGENNFDNNIKYLKSEKNIFLAENMLVELIKTKEDRNKYKEALVTDKKWRENEIFEFVPDTLQEFAAAINEAYILLYSKYPVGGADYAQELPKEQEDKLTQFEEQKVEYKLIEKGFADNLINLSVSNMQSIFREEYCFEMFKEFVKRKSFYLEKEVTKAIEQKGTVGEYKKIYLTLALQKITDAMVERQAGVADLIGTNYNFLKLYDTLGKNTELFKNSREFYIDVMAKKIVVEIYSIGTDSEFLNSDKKPMTMIDIEKDVKFFNETFPDGKEELAAMLDMAYGNVDKTLLKKLYKDEKRLKNIAENITKIRRMVE